MRVLAIIGLTLGVAAITFVVLSITEGGEPYFDDENPPEW